MNFSDFLFDILMIVFKKTSILDISRVYSTSKLFKWMDDFDFIETNKKSIIIYSKIVSYYFDNISIAHQSWDTHLSCKRPYLPSRRVEVVNGETKSVIESTSYNCDHIQNYIMENLPQDVKRALILGLNIIHVRNRVTLPTLLVANPIPNCERIYHDDHTFSLNEEY